jgi:hypothetical protein
MRATPSPPNSSLSGLQDVPEAAVEAYRAVEPWNRFKNFYDPTGINTISKPGGQATIHNLRGMQLKRIPDKGIYIQNGRKRLAGQ